MNAVELGPVPEEHRTQPAFDLFLIFAGANIVATTLVTGASLAPGFGTRQAHHLITLGSLAGAALVAALAPVGPRLGVPSVIAARAAFGVSGARLLALVLYASNFAWIALNNVIAASACAQVAGGSASERAWAVGLGIAATAVVAGGPRAVGLADRAAVPLMLGVGALMTAGALRLPASVFSAGGTSPVSWARGLDVVIAYQVSWILMFADYSRYTRSPGRGAAAVFLGLAGTSLWFMPLGDLGARAAGSGDPGAMLAALGLGPSGALLLALGTLTTNFVNIYLSALAWRSLSPGAGTQATVWSIGLVGSALSLLSRAWLDRYGDFMVLLGSALVPVGGVLLARLLIAPRPVVVAALYQDAGPHAGFDRGAMAAWVLGAVVYYAAAPVGGTVPSLLTATATALLLRRR
jgi:NCS1 family nucleobase:cation symporter-1